MVVLALDTATRQGSVALWHDGQLHVRAGDTTRTHAERLPGELIEVLAAASVPLALSDVTRFAIVSGPGSFTGLRVGMAAIQGLALATKRDVVPISTFEALVAGFHHVDPASSRTIVAVCQDGLRSDVFLAAYAPDDAGAAYAPDATGAAVAMIPPQVTDPESAVEEIARRLGDSLDRLVVIGDGAIRHAGTFHARLPGVPLFQAREPLAASAARLAAAPGARAISPHALRPFYLRRPDAVIARERAGLPDVAVDPLASFTVRRASGQDDLRTVEALQQRTFTNPWAAEAIRWELENTDVARLYLMADGDGVLVAYCACWMVFDELHINSLAVDETWRRRGLARRLLQHVFRDAVASGARAATLEVRHSNHAARALYQGLGFSVEGLRRDYYQQPREDALILWNRRLPSSLLVASESLW